MNNIEDYKTELHVECKSKGPVRLGDLKPMTAFILCNDCKDIFLYAHCSAPDFVAPLRVVNTRNGHVEFLFEDTKVFPVMSKLEVTI